MTRQPVASIEQRLADGVVLGAEGYVFELERRGYVKAGPYVPEVGAGLSRRGHASCTGSSCARAPTSWWR